MFFEIISCFKDKDEESFVRCSSEVLAWLGSAYCFNVLIYVDTYMIQWRVSCWHTAVLFSLFGSEFRPWMWFVLEDKNAGLVYVYVCVCMLHCLLGIKVKLLSAPPIQKKKQICYEYSTDRTEHKLQKTAHQV